MALGGALRGLIQAGTEGRMNGWATFIRQTSALCFILAIALALVLLTIKYEVQSLKDELGALDREIGKERETI